METYETNLDFVRVSSLRNTKSAPQGVSGFEKRNISVPRAVSPAIRLDISFPYFGMWGVTGESGRRREQAKYKYLYARDGALIFLDFFATLERLRLKSLFGTFDLSRG